MVSCGELQRDDPVRVRDGWGDQLFTGRILHRYTPSTYWVKSDAGQEFLVAKSKIERLAPMDMIDEAVAGMPRQMLEDDYKAMGAKVAALQAENEGLLAVIDMQVEAISAPARGANKAAAEGNDWGERLIDLLELYLVRTVGQRHPLAIADPDLRALVSHILD